MASVEVLDTKTNKSGLVPLGQAVLVRPYKPEVTRGKIFIPESVAERSMMVETSAVVIAIGPEAWKDESQPRARVGDHVMISAYCGKIVKGTADGEQYRIVNAEDIFCGIGR